MPNNTDGNQMDWGEYFSDRGEDANIAYMPLEDGIYEVKDGAAVRKVSPPYIDSQGKPRRIPLLRGETVELWIVLRNGVPLWETVREEEHEAKLAAVQCWRGKGGGRTWGESQCLGLRTAKIQVSFDSWG